MNQNKFETVVEPKNKVFDLKLKETFKYKDLILLFVKRDFVAKYKQTVLGPAWAIIQPLLTTVVFTVIFGSLAQLPTIDIASASEYVIPSFLFYMIGNICWQYISEVVNGTSNTFIGNSAIMGKVYFPRMVMPISITCANLISFCIQIVMFLLIWSAFLLSGTTDMRPSFFIFLTPLLVLQMMLLSMGFGVIISSLTTKYRDLAMIVTFGLQLWQYSSPIAYGLSMVPEKYLWLYMLNPVTPIVTTFRYAFFGVGYFNLTYYLIGWAVTIALLFIGMLLFNRIEKTFMDTV